MAKAKIGDNLLDVVLSNNLDIDGYGVYCVTYLIYALSFPVEHRL